MSIPVLRPAAMNLTQWLERIERLHPKSIDMGLERVQQVAGQLGLGRPAREVITVGGTNGKGSTVAFIGAIARAAAWKVGAYTSPHLWRYNERVRIDGALASDADIVAAFEAIEAARGEVLLTYFEYGTLAALWLFERAGLDLAILEVGLGGRLDATNIVDPDVAVITTVDLDHQDYLGNDRETIGREKAGIARGWKPLVLGDDDPPSRVLRHAYAIGASTIRIGCDFFVDVASTDQANDDAAVDAADADAVSPGHWRWREVGCRIDLPLPRMAAAVQLRNAAVAIAALRALESPPSAAAMIRGVETADLPGRLQRFERDGVELVVDVGHNPQAARELAGWLRAAPLAAAATTHAVYAALADKDVIAVVGALAEVIDHWHLAGLVEQAPRGIAVEDFAARLVGTEAASGSRHASVPDAISAARNQARAGDRILIFGSFHTAAAALAALDPTATAPV